MIDRMAVRIGRVRRCLRGRAGLLAMACLPLAGCGSVLSAGTEVGAGAAGAAAAAAVTKNATVAAGIGLAVGAGANAGLQYAERRIHRTEQDNIAEAAGRLRPGQAGRWSVEHDVPIEDDEQGQVAISREFGSGNFMCKEIVFSVDTAKDEVMHRAFYTANVCLDGKQWKWASAEPATERWGSLQ